MIIVIANYEHNERTGRNELLVSHGIDYDTGRTVILPSESPDSIGAVFHPSLGEFVLQDVG